MNPANQTLYDRYRQYILLEQGLSANTRDAYEHDVERFTEWCESEGRDVLTTDLALLHQYTEALYATDAAASSIARMLCGVRSFFRFLQLDGMIEQDPSELLRIKAAINLEKPEGQRDHCIIEVLYSCGLRVSEVCSLRLSDLFLTEGFIRVIGKGNKQRIVPISPAAIEEIGWWLDIRRTVDVIP